MKNIHLLLVLLFSLVSFTSFASAKTIKPQNTVFPLTLNSVEVVEDTSSNTTKYIITASATASNACAIPLASELYIVRSQDSKNLSLVVAKKTGKRICPANYDPKKYKINLGEYFHNAAFDSIIINGSDETP